MTTGRVRRLAIAMLGAGMVASGAKPASRPSVDYRLHADPTDSSGIAVDMRIRGAPAAFRVAMVAHTEYDDKFWRYLTDLRVEAPAGAARVTREDSAVWRVTGAGDDVTLSYRVRFPKSLPQQQAVWQAHLTPEGGLVGGPHSFLYVLGGERWPSTVVLDLPAGWTVATGLDSAATARTYTAPDVATLTDSPMLVGHIRSWRFDVDGVEHRISYLGHPGGVAFDTTGFVEKVERLTRETVRMFGRMPYRRYEFLFEDGASGGLEHLNSVSIGARSVTLAAEPDALLGQIAHEFFHTWNEVHLRPASWIGVRHAAPEPTGELWWSEGVTLYYADLLLRRAGLPTRDTTRVARLGRLITTYLTNPSHALVSPEATSRAFNRPFPATGDFTPNMFTQGELIGTVLDLMIRGGSDGTRSLDDAMRALSQRFTIARGFTGRDVEQAVTEACACDAHPFFARYIQSAATPDLDRWLGAVGLRVAVTWAPALATDRTPAPDIRFSAQEDSDDSTLRLNVWFSISPVGRAGFHSGDVIESLNGTAIHDVAAFRAVTGQLRIGDTMRVAVRRAGATVTRTLVIAGYERPTATVYIQPEATTQQRRLLEEWMAGR